MYSLKIGSTKLFETYGLVIKEISISTPRAKRTTINVPGANGLLELTSEPVRYYNRTLKFSLTKFDSDNKFSTLRTLTSQLMTTFNGVNDVLIYEVGQAEDTWHWHGFVRISGATKGSHDTEISIEMDAYPYQISNTKTASKSISTTASNITVNNTGSKPVEFITATSVRACSLTFNGSTVALGANTPTEVRFNLPVGSNSISAKTESGSGTLTITWTEEKL